MEKINFSSLGLNFKENIKTITFNDLNIDIKQNLPIKDKYDLIEITVEKAMENGVINPVLLEIAYNLNLIFVYSNLEFTEDERADLFALYDLLNSNGLLDAIVSAIPEQEFNVLTEWLNEYIDSIEKYNATMSATLQKFLNDMSINAEEMMKVVDNFDKDKFGAVVDFAKAANGNRPIE